MGKWLGAADLDLLPNIPLSIEVITVEEANCAKRLIDGAALHPPLLLQMHEKVKNLAGSEPCRRIGRIEGVELANPPEVILLCLLAKIFEMDSANKILVPWTRSDGII